MDMGLRLAKSSVPAVARAAASLSGNEWKAERAILVYGVRVGIRTNRPDVLEQFASYFPPLWKPTSVEVVERLFSLYVGQSRHVLSDDQDGDFRARSLKRLLESFETRLKMYVAEMARRRVFVHAGVVGWQGKAIVIPGRSFSGKTSLVAALVRAGATYYSDEYAVLDSQGRVHPYPQPLAVRQPGSGIQRKCPASEIGGVTGTAPLPVGQVIVSPYKEGARWRPAKLTAGQGVLELLANTVPARRKPEVVMPTLERTVSAADIQKGNRGEAEATARLILHSLNPMPKKGADA